MIGLPVVLNTEVYLTIEAVSLQEGNEEDIYIDEIFKCVTLYHTISIYNIHFQFSPLAPNKMFALVRTHNYWTTHTSRNL